MMSNDELQLSRIPPGEERDEPPTTECDVCGAEMKAHDAVINVCSDECKAEMDEARR